MTQEEKELLFKDLCSRLPYGVVVQQSPKYADKHFADKWETEPHDFNIIGVIGENTLVTDKNITEKTYAKGIVSKPVTICIYDGLTKQTVKPYLRPMSSMTEEENEEYNDIDNRAYSCPKDYAHIPAKDRIDWLLKNHFDFRGLIPKGLAIEVTKDNNPYE